MEMSHKAFVQKVVSVSTYGIYGHMYVKVQ
jgi:hypothetical protein